MPYVEGDTSCDGILVQPSIPYWNGREVPATKVVTQILVENATKEDLFLGPYAANGFVISRIYRRRTFGQLRFRTDIAMAEDICFWFDALRVNAKWVILNAEYYLYRQRPDSICGARNPHNCIQALESILHAVRVVGKLRGITDNAKVKYLLRFPYTAVDNLNLATACCKELSDDEWNGIKDKVEELEKEVGCWPFGPWLKIKMHIAICRRLSWLLPFCIASEKACLYIRRIGGVACREIGLKKG